MVCVIFVEYDEEMPFLLVTDCHKSFHLCLCKTRCLFLARMPMRDSVSDKWRRKWRRKKVFAWIADLQDGLTAITSEVPWIWPRYSTLTAWSFLRGLAHLIAVNSFCSSSALWNLPNTTPLLPSDPHSPQASDIRPCLPSHRSAIPSFPSLL